jgi:large subunit ribosomal protein L2
MSYGLLALGTSVADRILLYVDIRTYRINELSVPLNIGDSSLLYCISQGMVMHDVERYPGIGGAIARSAGTFSIMLRNFETIHKSVLKIPSGDVLSFSSYGTCTKGIVSNPQHKHISIGMAGRNRRLG